VVQFIRQLDEQRSSLQEKLQKELDELSETTIAIKTVRARLSELQRLNNEPPFSHLESERAELIARMQKWLSVAELHQSGNFHEVNRLKSTQRVDAVREALYREMFQPSGVPTALSNFRASDAAAPSLQPQLADPSIRVARFFDNVATKEKELREREVMLNKLRRVERKEKRLLNEIQQMEMAREEEQRIAEEKEKNARRIRDEYLEMSHRGSGAPTSNGIFRVSKDVPAERFFSGDARTSRHSPEKTRPAPVVSTEANPYLTRAIADRHRSSLATGDQVRSRLTGYLLSRQKV
jgi:hypothetical protein